MPDISTLLTFALALLVLEVTPGPDMMLVLARGIGQGRRVALLTVVGMVFVAGVVQVALLVLGVASLLKAYPASLLVLQWAGAAYLLYLGAKMIAASRRTGERRRPETAGISDRAAIRDGTINSLTNPKSLLFMFAFLPQFVDPEAGPVWLQLALLGTVQKLAGVLSLGGVALASGTVGQMLYRRPGFLQWQERFTGLVMLGLGLRLLLSGSGSASAAPLPAR
ncbi:LysE family translocator [Shinella sp. G-2]|uniref:LysE family translocator n=1 Tax=Shinella sp. G-2 TaxID=3133141 RepID=UPI003D06E865